MTYCVAIKVDQGLVFAADTRTSASVDDVRTYLKLHAFEFAEDRVMVVMTAGNLGTTQAILARTHADIDAGSGLRTVRRLHDAAEYLGAISARVQKHRREESGDAEADFRASLILGGQIAGGEPELYLIYPEGNCIASSPETPYLQIGELKYGKPILDRVIRAETTLDDAARCALVSLDSTIRSNISVGPPLDLAIVPAGALKIARRMRLDTGTPYYIQLREAWGRNLVAAFRDLPRFEWETETLRDARARRT
jgi:putative proteasome-type protease